MTEDDEGEIAAAIHAHGDQLGGNLVFLKAFLDDRQKQQQQFLDRQQEREQQFLAHLQSASDRTQRRGANAAMFAAIAAFFAAAAAGAQAYVAWHQGSEEGKTKNLGAAIVGPSTH